MHIASLVGVLALAAGTAAQGTAPCFEEDVCDEVMAAYATTEAQCTLAGADCQWVASGGKCRARSVCPTEMAAVVGNADALAAMNTVDNPATDLHESKEAMVNNPLTQALLVRDPRAGRLGLLTDVRAVGARRASGGASTSASTEGRAGTNSKP